MPSSQTATPVNELAELKPTQLVPHKNNIRKDVGDVSTLADSLAAQGVIEPLQVVPNGKPDKYVILAGHRRQAAAKLAKLRSVPCIVRHDLVDDEPGQIAVMIAENIERSDLSAVEEAHGVQLLMDLGLSAAAIATSTGMSTKRVRERVKITKLSDDTRAKLADHAVTLADAVFIADHGKDEEDLADLEQALGTNNWAVTKQQVVDRARKRQQVAKLVKAIEAEGLKIAGTQVDYPSMFALDREIEQRLGFARHLLVEQRSDWPPTAELLAKAIENKDTSYVNINSSWTPPRATLYVYTAPPAELASPDVSTPPASVTPPADDDDEDEPVGPPPEQIERQQRREALDAATTVRRDFIASVIAGGKLEHAQLAGQTAPAAGDYIELGWGDVLPFLPIRNEYVGQSMSSDEMREVVTEWVDRQTNPYVLCLTLAWVFLTWIDGHLVSTLNPNYLDAEELRAVDRYALLLETCGYVFSDIELEGINAVREALVQEEPDTEDADG